MNRSRHLTFVMTIATVAIFLVGGSASAAVRGANGTVAQAVIKLPVWTVNGPAINAASAQSLADSLGLPDSGFNPNTNSVSFFDQSFMAIPSNLTGEEGKDESGNPTQTDVIDMDGLKAMTAFPAQDAMDTFLGALADNQLEPLDGTARVSRSLTTANSFFDVFFTPGASNQESLHIPFATTASWQISLGTQGTPLVGPGAKVSATFDGDGNVTQLHYAMRMMTQGQNAVLITPAQANKLATSQVKSQCGVSQLQSLRLTTKPVYFAPPMDLQPTKIYPWYQVDGTAMVGDQLIQLKSLLVPAVSNAPKASIAASVKGGVVNGRAIVTGGTPPYKFQWTSCLQSLDPAKATGQTVQYGVGGRASSSLERLNLVVTDANGLTAEATRTLVVQQQSTADLARFVQGRRTTKAIGPIDVGAETVGTSMGLPGCIPDTTGFVGRMAISAIPTEFQWYNGNAWEQDFKDPSKPSGDDTSYADHVDETFYCGHANGNGFSFPGSHTDTFLNYTDAYWGNTDLEWLGIAACGPLQSTAAPDWWQRWGPAFGGLHLLLGYQTTSFDATGEGFDFANGQLGPFWWGSPMTVLQSWIQMAINNQPSSVTWAIMGVMGAGGVSNYNDYFWGKGPTGPDIQPSSIVGYYKVYGPS